MWGSVWLLCFCAVAPAVSETIEMNYIEDVIVTPCYLDMGYVDMGYIDTDKYGVKEDATPSTEMDPHEYVRLKRSSTTTQTRTSDEETTTVAQKPKRKRRRRVGRPRKATMFPLAEGETEAPRKRLKWDQNMNKFIMYTYYYVTKMETDRHQYRRKMKEKFLQAYPEWTAITEQRLADQKRSIRQNRLVDIDTIREIKKAVKKELEEQGVVIEPGAPDSQDRSFYD